MKSLRLMLAILLILGCSLGNAQELKITAFQRMDRDLLARTQERLDLNDNPCAVIRVSVANVDKFSFEGNIIGEVIYSPGEALVYMTQGSQRLRIKSNDYGTIVYEFPERLQKQTVYKLDLSSVDADPFSAERMLQAEKIIDRHLKQTGLYRIVESGVLPPYTEIKDYILKKEGQKEQYIEARISLDTLSKKMFFYEKGTEYGLAYGKSGDKYWGGSNGKVILFMKNYDHVEAVYENAKSPYNLNILSNKDYIYTVGDGVKMNGEECEVVLVANKDNRKPFLSVYFAKNTGLLIFFKDEVQNATISLNAYKQYGDYYLNSEFKQVVPGKFELSVVIKDCCFGCPVDDSLLNARNVKKASKKQKAKKK